MVPDSVCWTEVPESLADLLRQRRRWHRGLTEATWRHRRVVGRPRYRGLGFYAVPYLMLELGGPLVELAAYGFVTVGAILGVLSVPVFAGFLCVSLLTNMVTSIAALALAEVSYRRRAAGRTEALRQLGYAVLENFGYRQLVSLWCFFGVLDFARRRKKYTQPTRHGFSAGPPRTAPAVEGPPVAEAT